MVIGEKTFLPCTPHGVLQLLLRSGVKLDGAEVVVVGRSNIVGKPLANLLLQKSPYGNATVTVCHTRTKDLAAHTLRADVIRRRTSENDYCRHDPPGRRGDRCRRQPSCGCDRQKRLPSSRGCGLSAG